MQKLRFRGRARLGIAAAGMAVGALALAPAASANTLTAGTLTQVPDHPFAGTSSACDAQIAFSKSKGSVNFNDAEVEPTVAANPANTQQLVASWQQDRWNDGGANGDITAVSGNGGSTWSLATSQPPFAICEGGSLNRSSDVSDSWSADGSTVYQASLAFNANGPAFGGTSSVQVSRSTDGGDTWSTPAVLREDTSTTVLNDKEWVTADPTNSSLAYTVWDRLESPSTNANPTATVHTPAFRGPAWFSMTSNKGLTWSPSRIIFNPGQNNQTIDNEVQVVQNGPNKGDLIDGFLLILNKRPNFKHGRTITTYFVADLRSTDHGATWSAPTIVSQLVHAPVFTLDGQLVRSGDILPQFTSDPTNGNLYVTWQDGRFSSTGAAKVAFSMSTDGGKTWSAPIRIDQSPNDAPAFQPTITVNSAGTIGVTYFDMENATPTTAGAGNTDAFIVHCHAATADCTDPASWSAGGETRITNTGSFDMRTAPNTTSGLMVGDYEGLTTSGTTFDPFDVLAKPIATKGITDPFASTAS